MKKLNIRSLVFILLITSACTNDNLEFVALFPEFELSAENALVFDEVKMINKSDGEIKSYSWTFENGIPETSTEESPIVKFTTIGENEITLTVINNNVSKTIKKTITISDNLNLEINPSFFDIREGQLQALDISFEGTDKLISWSFDNQNHGTFDEENTYFAPQSIRRGIIIAAKAAFENFPGREKTIYIIHRGENDFKSCDTFGQITQGDLYMNNNMFNTVATNNWSFCSYVLDRTNSPIFIWNWDVNVDGEEQLIGFPNLLYGKEQNPTINRNTVSNNVIPAKLEDSKNTQITFDYEAINNTGQSKLYLEMLFSKESDLLPNQDRFIVRVLLTYKNISTSSKILKENIIVNGDTYSLYQEENDDLRPEEKSIFSFYPKEFENKKTLNIIPILKYLKSNNLIDGNVYLQNVRFGNEVKSGQGTTIIKQFTVKLNE